MAQEKLVLRHGCCPGDITVLTALPRDIQLTYPGRFEIHTETHCKELWQNNPHIASVSSRQGKELRQKRAFRPDLVVNCMYNQGVRKQKHETLHFIRQFHDDFAKQANISIEPQFPYGDLHLSPAEKARPVEGRYWLILAGGKSDFPVKAMNEKKWQGIVDGMRGNGIHVVQAGATSKGCWNPALKNVHNVVGQTDLRDLLRLIYHSDGIICGLTCGMHMAAALHRPCVCVAGGRESWYWEAYVNENMGFGPTASGKVVMPHRFLHTIGLLDCCQRYGCWKNKLVSKKKDNCKYPIINKGTPIAKCLDMISNEHILEAVMSYYEDNSLPPVGHAAAPQAPVQLTTGTTTRDGKEYIIPPPLPDVGFKVLDRFAGQNKKPRKIVTAPPGSQVVAATAGPTADTTPANDSGTFDHSAVGGRFTAFVLLYGGEPFYSLHARCLTSLINTMPEGRLDLRVGSNQLNNKSLALVEKYVDSGVITKHYRHNTNDKKYPVMREMFHDKSHPITTKWLMWFDDDTVCDKNPRWASILCETIISHHKRGNHHMFGAVHHHHITAQQKAFCESRNWWHGKPWRLANGKESPNGNKSHFASGGFWAITKEAMLACDIPDVLLQHNGGDVLIGEQLHQGGYNLKQFNGSKQYVHTSSVPRRGLSEPHFGTTEWQKQFM